MEIQKGDTVKMSATIKQMLIDSGCKAHVDEFGDCIGIVEDPVDFNNNGENDPDKIGPEVDVRWKPSNLVYGYLPERDLLKINE